MGFWSKLGGALKGIGKVALKAAPIATAFIPGVGLPLSMAIGAGAGIGSSKLGGGSWKDALMSGGMGAGMGALGNSGFLGKLGSKLGVGSSGAKLGGVSEALGMGPTVSNSPSIMSRILGGLNTGSQFAGALGGLGGGGNNIGGIGSSRLGSYNNPNLLNPLMAGRMAAMSGTSPNGWPPIQQNRNIPRIPSKRPRPINNPTTGMAIPRFPGEPRHPMIMDF